jgi:hypothetical protein
MDSMNTSPLTEYTEELGYEKSSLEFKHLRGSLTAEERERLVWLETNLPPRPAPPTPEVEEKIQNFKRWFRFHTREKQALKDSILKRTELGYLTTDKAFDILYSMERREIYTTTAFNENQCHLAWKDYLTRSRHHKAPRPIQTRLAVLAGREAEIVTLHGAAGLGKTTAAIRAIVWRRLRDSEDRPAIAISGMALSRLSISDRSDFVEKAAYHGGPLLLDDIDKGSKAEGVSSTLLEIIEGREHCGFLTMITTNCTGRSLEAKLYAGYGEPVVARLARNIIINFDTEHLDFGTEKAVIDAEIEKLITLR